MAQKVTGHVKLQIPAGQGDSRAPPVPPLGQHGINAAFTKEFNQRTKNDVGLITSPWSFTVYADRSFTFITKTAAVLMKGVHRVRLRCATRPKWRPISKGGCPQDRGEEDA